MNAKIEQVTQWISDGTLDLSFAVQFTDAMFATGSKGLNAVVKLAYEIAQLSA